LPCLSASGAMGLGLGFLGGVAEVLRSDKAGVGTRRLLEQVRPQAPLCHPYASPPPPPAKRFLLSPHTPHLHDFPPAPYTRPPTGYSAPSRSPLMSPFTLDAVSLCGHRVPSCSDRIRRLVRHGRRKGRSKLYMTRPSSSATCALHWKYVPSTPGRVAPIAV
jgi:hypothetical protein